MRNHRFIMDGPVQNACPDEALTPVVLFLAGVATCGVEVVGVIAKAEGTLSRVAVDIKGVINPSRLVRFRCPLFNLVRLQFRMKDVSRQQGELLVAKFKAQVTAPRHGRSCDPGGQGGSCCGNLANASRATEIVEDHY